MERNQVRRARGFELAVASIRRIGGRGVPRRHCENRRLSRYDSCGTRMALSRIRRKLVIGPQYMMASGRPANRACGLCGLGTSKERAISEWLDKACSIHPASAPAAVRDPGSSNYSCPDQTSALWICSRCPGASRGSDNQEARGGRWRPIRSFHDPARSSVGTRSPPAIEFIGSPTDGPGIRIRPLSTRSE